MKAKLVTMNLNRRRSIRAKVKAWLRACEATIRETLPPDFPQFRMRVARLTVRRSAIAPSAPPR